jgi:hypothetical protein
METMKLEHRSYTILGSEPFDIAALQRNAASIFWLSLAISDVDWSGRNHRTPAYAPYWSGSEPTAMV